MEVTRTSLRTQKNQVPKQVRQGGQTQQKGGYGEEVKQQGQEVFNIRSDRPVIQAKRVDPIVSETVEYTKDAVKTAMEKLKKFVLSQGLGGDTSGATEQTTPFAGTGGGGGGRPDFFSGLTNDQLGLLSTQELVDRDNEMYGDTFPEGSFSPTDTGAMVNRDKMLYGDTFPKGSFNITPPTLAEKQSQKTYEQNRLKEGEKFADRGEREAVNASGFQQANVRGSAFNTGKDESQRPRQTVAALPSDYKETEAKAFLDAKAYQALKDSGLDKTVGGEDAQVNVGSGRLGSFGLGTAGEGAPSGSDLKPGSFGISTIKREDQAERMGGQGGLALGTTTQRQGGTVKDGVKVAKKESPAVNASSFQQKNVRGVGVSGTGKDESARPTIDTKSFLNKMKAKTDGVSAQDTPKQTVASLPSNYKQTEAKSFARAKSFQDYKALGKAAEKATGIQTKPKAGSFGISEAGRKEAEANKKAAAEAKKAAEAKAKADAEAKAKAAEAKRKAEQAKKEAEARKAAEAKAKAEADARAAAKAKAEAEAKAENERVARIKKAAEEKKRAEAAKKAKAAADARAKAAAEGKSKAQQAAEARKATGKSISQTKADNRESMRAAAAERHKAFKAAKAEGKHARTASQQRARNKAAAKARAKAAAKARNKRKAASRNTSRRRSRRGRRGRRRCDIFLKFDIRLLTNNNLRHDDLAEVAYFVRALRELD